MSTPWTDEEVVDIVNAGITAGVIRDWEAALTLSDDDFLKCLDAYLAVELKKLAQQGAAAESSLTSDREHATVPTTQTAATVEAQDNE